MYNYVNIKRIPHCRNSASPCMTAKKLEQRSKGVWCQKTPCACRPQSSPSLSLCCSFTVLNVTNPLYDHLLQNRCCYKTKQNKTCESLCYKPGINIWYRGCNVLGFFFLLLLIVFFLQDRKMCRFMFYIRSVFISKTCVKAQMYTYI